MTGTPIGGRVRLLVEIEAVAYKPSGPNTD